MLHFTFSLIISVGGVSIEGDSDSWDFGTGAGFYVDATEKKWSKHYRMYSYIVKELHYLVMQQLPIVSIRERVSQYDY